MYTMIPPGNRHLTHLNGTKCDDQLDPKLLEKITQSRNSVFDEMCREINVKNYKDIRAAVLNRRNVTKDLLCLWLEAVCCIADSFCVPQLQEVTKRLDEQNSKIIEGQNTIIDLQKKVIENKEDELKSLKNSVHDEVKSTVQTTVETELKSYSSALSKTCSAALAPKKIQAAVKSASEKDDRSRNVIIYGAEEADQEMLSDKVSEILLEIGEKPTVRDCCRVGLRKGTTPRPVKFSLSSSDLVNQVLRKARLLRTKEGFQSVYISPDRTVEERRAYKRLIEELKKKRQAEPDKFYIIRNNKIVSTAESSPPAQTGKT